MSTPARLLVSFVALASAAGLLAPGSIVTPAIAGQPPIRLKVMSFNIQYGASLSTLDAVVKAIRRADADVVGIQEAFGRTAKIGRMLDWYAAPSMHLVSRFPIVRPDGTTVPGSPGGRVPEGASAYLLLGGGAVAAIGQTHLPSWPYGVQAMMQGAGPAEVTAKERSRVEWLAPHLEAAQGPIGDGLPTFLTGDLNSPSHLDWTEEAVEALGWQPPWLHPPGERYAFAWPTTVSAERAGFRDSYREAHPDPVADPGFTYCVDLYPACGRWDTWDRIDYVDAAGPSTTVRSQVVGDGGPYADIVSRPWPTDHRAVVSTFDVTPVPPPSFAAPLDEIVELGRKARIAFHDPAANGRAIGVWARGDDPASDAPLISSPLDDGAEDGVVALDTSAIAGPGVFTVALTDDGGTVATSKVTVADSGADPWVRTTEARYEQGEPIRVQWSGAPGNQYDWLSLIRGCFDPEACPLRQWRYVNADAIGSGRFTRDSEGIWPLRTGRYAVGLCVDDDYDCIAVSDVFRIVAA